MRGQVEGPVSLEGRCDGPEVDRAPGVYADKHAGDFPGFRPDITPENIKTRGGDCHDRKRLEREGKE